MNPHAAKLGPELIRAALDAQGFFRLVGAEVASLGEGTCGLRVRVRPELTQQNGLLHGGVIAFLVDNATTAAAATLIGAQERVITAEYKLNLLSPGLGEVAECHAKVIRPGRQLVVASADVFVFHRTGGHHGAQGNHGSGRKHVATALASIARLSSDQEPRAGERPDTPEPTEPELAPGA